MIPQLLNFLPYPAFIDNGGLVFLIPIVALCIPIVKILVSHQQRMAEIIHSTSRPEVDAQVNALRAEVYELKQLVHQQMITIDSLSQPRIPVTTEIQERLEH